MGQKCKVLVVYYEEEQEEELEKYLEGPTAEINEKFIEVTNPYTGRPGWISDLVNEMITRSEMREEV